MFPLCWANTANIGAFTTRTQAGFQSLPLGSPEELVGGVRGAAPGPRRFALEAELGICESSTPSTSKRSGHGPLRHKLAQATGALSARGGAGGPRASDDRLPDPMKPMLGCWRLSREDADEQRWPQGLWSPSLGDAE